MLSYTTYVFREVRKVLIDNPGWPGSKLQSWEYTGNDRVVDDFPDWRERTRDSEFWDTFNDYAKTQFGDASDGYELFPLESYKPYPDRKIVDFTR